MLLDAFYVGENKSISTLITPAILQFLLVTPKKKSLLQNYKGRLFKRKITVNFNILCPILPKGLFI